MKDPLRAFDLEHKRLLERDLEGGASASPDGPRFFSTQVAMGLLRKYLVDAGPEMKPTKSANGSASWKIAPGGLPTTASPTTRIPRAGS